MLCPSRRHSQRGYRLTSCYKNNRRKKVWCRIPSCLFSSGVGGRGLTNVLRLHPHLLLFLFVDIPSPAFWDGAIQAARLITEMPVTWGASPRAAWVSPMSARPQTHESDKVTGKPNLVWPPLCSYMVWRQKQTDAVADPFLLSLAVTYTRAELRLQTRRT